MNEFDHERLPVYVAAIDFVALADAVRRLGLVDDACLQAGRELLLRIVAMPIQMVRRTADSGTGSGSARK